MVTDLDVGRLYQGDHWVIGQLFGDGVTDIKSRASGHGSLSLRDSTLNMSRVSTGVDD